MPFPTSGAALYLHVLNATVQRWNTDTPAFEAYNAANWEDYSTALSEQGSSRLYYVPFPSAIAAGLYSIAVYEQAGVDPAESDAPIFAADGHWDGANFVIVGNITTRFDTIDSTLAALPAATAALILSVPANLLATDSSGRVTATPASVTAIAEAVWGVTTRTLSSFGTLATTTAAAVWAYGGGRTLSAFAFTVTTSLGTAIKAVTDKVGAMIEGTGPYLWTAGSLANTPAGDATEAKQDTIITALGDLHNPTEQDIVDALMAEIVDGSVTVEALLKALLSKTKGQLVVTGTSPGPYTFTWKDQAGATLWEEEYAADGSRTPG